MPGVTPVGEQGLQRVGVIGHLVALKRSALARRRRHLRRGWVPGMAALGHSGQQHQHVLDAHRAVAVEVPFGVRLAPVGHQRLERIAGTAGHGYGLPLGQQPLEVGGPRTLDRGRRRHETRLAGGVPGLGNRCRRTRGDRGEDPVIGGDGAGMHRVASSSRGLQWQTVRHGRNRPEAGVFGSCCRRAVASAL